MNRLQLYISKSGAVFKTLADINGTENVRKLMGDCNAAVEAVDYDPSRKTVFFIIRQATEGCLAHVIRTIPPAAGNHLDATLFIPRSLDITTDEIAEVLETVASKVMAASMTEKDMADLETLLSRSYDTDEAIRWPKPSRGKKFGVIVYGDGDSHGFADCLDYALWQSDCSRTQAVLLLHEPLRMKESSDAVSLYGDEYGPRQEQAEEKPIKGDLKDDNTDKRAMTYSFALPMATPEGRSSLEFEIQSAKAISRSPVAGYEAAGKIVEGGGNVNQLRRSHGKGMNGRSGRIVSGLAGLIAGIVVMSVIGSLFDKSDTGSMSTDQGSTIIQTPVISAEASAYLDGKRIWRRDEMERIDGLAGLFDDMNNYRFEKLSGQWAASLASSKNFAKVAAAAKKALSKKVDPRRADEHSPCYNREGDIAIGWTGYTYWIDP